MLLNVSEFLSPLGNPMYAGGGICGLLSFALGKDSLSMDDSGTAVEPEKRADCERIFASR